MVMLNRHIAVRVKKRPVTDGKRAYLPHPVFQSTLFAATRARQENEYRKRSVVIERTNNFGDVLTIRSPRTLFTCPDMGVFLATVACVQKAGFERVVRPSTGQELSMLVSEFPLKWLYELTRIRGDGKGWYQLLTSLETLGSVSISVKFANDTKNMERHGSKCSFVLDSFWSLRINKRKGRGGSIVEIYPSKFLIPTKSYLWADAELCNKLRSDTARGVFWQLISREHLAGTVEEWQSYLGARSWEPRVWKSLHLMPALEELANYGYNTKESINEQGAIEIVVKRPMFNKVLHSGKKVVAATNDREILHNH